MNLASLALGFGAGVGASGAAFMLLGGKPDKKQALPPAPTARQAAPAVRSRDVDLSKVVRSRDVDLAVETSAAADTAGLDHPALKFGVPIADYLRFYTNFVSSFDARTRNPQWVIERITKDTITGPGDRKNSDFFEDQEIEQRFRSKLSDYRRSGYDRGHLAPAGDNKDSQQAMDETHTLSNMSPQVGEGFNRDYWARFERFVRDLTNVSDAVYCITGPLYIPEPDSKAAGKWRMNYPLIGRAPQLVAVPTHFYKVVLAEREGREPTVGAFIMPNAPIDPSLPLSSFVISLDMLESAAGVKFFPQALTDNDRQALDAAALRIATEARLQLAGTVPQGLLPPAVSLPASQPSAAPPRRGSSRHLCDNVACTLPGAFRAGRNNNADD